MPTRPLSRTRSTLRRLLVELYSRRVERRLDRSRLPGHVAIVVDGNRRWARAFGASSATGHRAGAEKVSEFLGWCEELGIEVVTIFLLSTDNLNRPAEELEALMDIIGRLARESADTQRWRIQGVGNRDVVPQEVADALADAENRTRNVRGLHVNLAVGYGGRREIADAVRALLDEHAKRGTPIEELAESVDAEHIAAHLYTKGQPDPDLVIRASGEQRLSDFLIWQSARSEFYFCEALWPDFRRVDFVRALRVYTARERRFGR